MGKGIDLARAEAPLHAQVLDDFKDQLLIAFLRRLTDDGAREFSIPVAEVDSTGGFLVAFSVDEGRFNFEVRRKE